MIDSDMKYVESKVAPVETITLQITKEYHLRTHAHTYSYTLVHITYHMICSSFVECRSLMFVMIMNHDVVLAALHLQRAATAAR